MIGMQLNKERPYSKFESEEMIYRDVNSEMEFDYKSFIAGKHRWGQHKNHTKQKARGGCICRSKYAIPALFKTSRNLAGLRKKNQDRCFGTYRNEKTGIRHYINCIFMDLFRAVHKKS